MKQNLNNKNPINVIRVRDELVQFLLVELAWGRDLEAGISDKIHGEVLILCPEGKAVDLLKTARPAAELLKARKLEAVAEAVLAAGGKPSAVLLEAIRRRRRRAGLVNKVCHWLWEGSARTECLPVKWQRKVTATRLATHYRRMVTMLLFRNFKSWPGRPAGGGAEDNNTG